jgi:ankyrin repeat protein
VEFLLNTDTVDVNATDKNDWTALFWAACGGHLDVVNFLLSFPNIDVYARSAKGKTAVLAAVEAGHLDVFARFLNDPRIATNLPLFLSTN